MYILGSPQHNNSQSTQINNKPTYNVKLPKFTGKTEADKKYDLMLKQLEHEMDEKEKKENFGNCDACGKEVIGERQACQAMEKIYHSDCFVCCACGRSLKEKEFYNVNGTIYCEEDYLVSTKLDSITFFCLHTRNPNMHKNLRFSFPLFVFNLI